MRHSNIVNVYDFGEFESGDSQSYLAASPRRLNS